MSDTEHLSEYEKLRRDKIKRNEQKLKELGLDKEGIPAALRKQKQKKTAAAKRKSFVPSEPMRRSSRKKRKSVNYNENEGHVVEVDADFSEFSGTDEAASPSGDEESIDDGEYEEESINDGEEYAVLTVKRVTGRQAEGEDRAQSDVASSQLDSTCGLTLELAKTGRSTCRKCNNKIEKGSPRVGMKAWIVGRQAVTWQCPKCFLDNLTCGYEASGRTRCKATNTTFTKGELKIGARSHTAKAFFKVSAIASILESVIVLVSQNGKLKSLDDSLQVHRLEGHEDLTPSDRSRLQSIMDDVAGKQSPSSTTRKSSTRRTNLKEETAVVNGGNAMRQQPTLGLKSGTKGRVEWKFGGHKCYGTLLPSKETKTHCFARTHKGNVKTLAKGKDYWTIIS